MRFLSVCSGIEAASQAWTPLGWNAVAFSEIEPFPCAVLAHHYPTVPNWGDMTKFKEWPDATFDVLCGGTPCQSFSVAGLRKGLDDPRGNLMLTYLAIAARYRPEWLVWENVPGVLSSNGGRDFGSFLWGLGELGYGFAYRVLDAQYFGVPQRRRRVFVVGCLGGWRRAAAVLFDRHSLSGNPAPSRQAGKRPAPTLSARTKGGGGLGTDFDCDGGLVHAIQGNMLGRADHAGPAGSGINSDGVSFTLTKTDVHAVAMYAPSVSPALKARDYKGPSSDGDGDGSPLIAHSLRGEGFDASEDGTGRGTPLVPVAYSIMPMNSGKDYKARETDVAQPIMAGGPVGGNQGGDYIAHPVAFDPTQITHPENRSNPQPGDPCHTLAKGMHAPASAFQERGREGGRNLEIGGETAFALTAPAGGGRAQERNIAAGMQVRRLTPVECARLQGFPDHYLDITYRGKPAADGPKYKALGNSWAVPCARWIGERIDQVTAISAIKEAA